MSMWRKFQKEALKDVEPKLFEKALGEMGLEIDYNVKTVSNAYGSESVDAALIKNGHTLPMGFRFVGPNKREVEISGDFHMTGLNNRDFVNELSQTYQKHHIIDKLQKDNWTIERAQIVGDDIVIDAVQWA